MNWLAVVTLIFRYGPSLLQALLALLSAIKARNTELGASAATQGAEIAKQVVLSLSMRNDLTNEQKREQAVADIMYMGSAARIAISESEARTLSELALQGLKAEKK